MKNSNRVLITGGAGFIGSHLSLKLLSLGYKVTVLDLLKPQIHGDNIDQSYTFNLIKDKVNFIHGDANSIVDLIKALDNQDYVFHLAAETGTGQSMYQVDNYIQNNIASTAKLYQLINENKFKIKKIIISSSRAVYGEGKYECNKHGIVYPTSRTFNDVKDHNYELKCPYCFTAMNPLPTDEKSLLSPTSIYGFTKQAQEQISSILSQSMGVPSICLRFQNVYGPGQSLKNPYTGILSIFSSLIKNGQDINIFEDGLESRDFIYIDDVVNSMILGLNYNTTSLHETFNVGTGKPTTVFEIAQILSNLYKVNTKLTITNKYRLGDIRHNFADVTKASQQLGFKSKITVQNGLFEFVNWVNLQDVKRIDYEKSMKELASRDLFK
jgi:dTDP-L-rhamnose 4-epimerase